MAATLRVATRGSALARTQAERVIARLGISADLVIITTAGDAARDVPIHVVGGTGVFVKEVQQAVLDGRADIAVHSATDLPTEVPDGLVLAAVPERGDPRDALVGTALTAIPTAGLVGTGSVRRRAQLAHERPDLRFGELRGNIPTRLDRAVAFDAVVVAAAALERLGRSDAIAEVLDPKVMLPQVAQGALAVECRADDAATRSALRAVDDAMVHAAVDAERAYLHELGGGCNLPCGALAVPDGHDGLRLEVMLASLDGRVALRAEVSGTDPVAVGEAAAASLLHEHGAAMLLTDSDGGAAFAEPRP